ncbi:hypothetical protein SCA03_20970 [Streptomyces cacaoi]|uniref:Uncharacterized protein n=1 Tax=Streptomyces cacaoi TaxID=1898 RepID=A0A4Y3QVV4_STRCI|nr:hypothetical protein SCA03_20970 [Streptomyces cacaoi]
MTDEHEPPSGKRPRQPCGACEAALEATVRAHARRESSGADAAARGACTAVGGRLARERVGAAVGKREGRRRATALDGWRCADAHPEHGTADRHPAPALGPCLLRRPAPDHDPHSPRNT